MNNKVHDMDSGLLVKVFRWNLGDCSNNGPSKDADDILLVLPDQGGPFTVEQVKEKNIPVAYIDWREGFMGRDRMPVIRFYSQDDFTTMMGGNFAYSCDGRFPFDYPIPIHDRLEVKPDKVEFKIEPNTTRVINGIEFTHEYDKDDDPASNIYVVKGEFSASLTCANDTGEWCGRDDPRPIPSKDLKIIEKVYDWWVDSEY